MAENILRGSPTGAIVGRRGAVTIPQIAVAASSTGSGTIAVDDASVGDNVYFNARASLGNVSAPQAFVSAAGVVTLVFATGGAALTIPTQVCDCGVWQF